MHKNHNYIRSAQMHRNAQTHRASPEAPAHTLTNPYHHHHHHQPQQTVSRVHGGRYSCFCSAR